MTYCELLRVWESDWGRAAGWDLELDGRIVAVMEDPRFEEMFWDSYRLTATTEDPALAAELMTDGFWKGIRWQSIKYHSRATGLVIERGFPALTPFTNDGRIVMRALYVDVDHPMPWDWVILWFRRFLRRLRKR